MGWAAFAGIMLITAGIFQALAGTVALVDDEYFVIGANYTYKLDTTSWGWIHLLIGLILFLCGIGIFTGKVLARTIGVLAAVGSMISKFMWLPYNTFWAVVVIAIDIAVIWALTVHGRDLAGDR
jgi:uncharacterized membrane protein